MVPRKASQGNRLIGLLFCSTLLSLASADGHWQYGDGPNGPKNWPHHYETCGPTEKKQSPIDLTKPFKKDLGGIEFMNYNAILKNPTLSNNGHTVQFTTETRIGKITGGCMGSQIYRFQQFHLHWGSKDSRGSEHQLYGKVFPMEIHVLHVNDKYTLGEATNHMDGFSVLGIFFEITEKDNPAFTPIINAMKNIKLSNKTTNINGNLTLQSLLPDIVNKYMCYDGSLTTPPCSEVITWTVFVTPISISENQMQAFRALHTGETLDSGLMSDNFRPIQPLGHRKIYLYDSASTTGFSFVSLLLAMLCYFCQLSLYTKSS